MWGLIVACLVGQPCTDEIIDTYPTKAGCDLVAPVYVDRNPECLEIADVIHKDGSVVFPE